jgi:hypothetical protein
MKRRSLILPLVLAGGLSSIYFLPQAGEVAQSAVRMTLPTTMGPWFLKPVPPSPEEVTTLDRSTTFAKAVCLSARPGEFSIDGDPIPDRADLSVVLSGYDLNNSIHRPERCMRAQGHTLLSETTISLKLDNGRELPVRRLRSVQTLKNLADRKLDQQIECVTYYFFVGHERVETDHLKRTLIDMRDRLVHGMDQRWAYITTTMWFGKMPWIDEPISEAEADAKLRALLIGFAEEQINWEQIKP